MKNTPPWPDAKSPYATPLRAAEFFAGIGLVRRALEQAGFYVVWANDIAPSKHDIYAENFDDGHFQLGDIRVVRGTDLPAVDLATASFPCTDLSLAGNRKGIHQGESSMFWEFARVLREMGDAKPKALLLENVPGFATSNGGRDLRDAVVELNSLGYSCDLTAVNASHFVAQSRLRVFIVGLLDHHGEASPKVNDVRPPWLVDFYAIHSESLRLHAAKLDLPPAAVVSFADVAERVPRSSERWWQSDRKAVFVDSLAPLHRERLNAMQRSRKIQYRTAYRRTRGGTALWEIRADHLAGCLRTPRGGSSKQAVVEAGRDRVGVRWMTAREYAALQGAPDFKFANVSENKALFGFGDAVCVPVIKWIAENYLVPALRGATLVAA